MSAAMDKFWKENHDRLALRADDHPVFVVIWRGALEHAIRRANTVDVDDVTTGPAWFDENRDGRLTYADGRRDAAASIRAELEAEP